MIVSLHFQCLDEVLKMTRKKKQAEDTSSAVNEKKDFTGLSDEIYLNNVDVEDQLTNCMESILKFKPDKPLDFMHSFFKLSKTKEYPYIVISKY